jgi:hypothetical protein
MKKGVSVIVSYVLLILLSISLAGMIYGFLQYRVKHREKLECPAGVSIYVENYSCNNDKINLTLKNNGLWHISGVNIKIYLGNKINNITNFNQSIPIDQSQSFWIEKGNKVEILPFIEIKNKKVYCSDALILYDITCE